MANLGVPEDTTEVEDKPEALQAKVKKLAQLIRQSAHVVAYTGAGISTSTGIPDFRGPQGVWTLRAQGRRARGASAGMVSPSLAHMALVKLQRVGKLKALVSQNVDGLHYRSGIDPDKLAELHGNTNVEQCAACGRKYWRPFGVREAEGVHEHATSRRCESCGGRLRDTIVNFGESLPSDALEKAVDESRKADLGLVLGTSLRVSPAANLPQLILQRGHPLVIVNLQKTPLDDVCTLKINGRTDDVMAGVMKELKYDIPPVEDKLMEARKGG